MEGAIYPTVQDALAIADENMDARKELARQGPNHMIVAEIGLRPGGFELRAVTVQPWAVQTPSPATQYIVRDAGHPETFECPVCTRSGTITRQVIAPRGTVPIVEGLDPEHCVGCHDTLTTRGRPPTVVRAGDVVEIVPRPV